LIIKENKAQWLGKVELPAGISSQYISSLMMIAPTLQKGLKIKLVGELVSRPYLEMTAKIMEYFGVYVHWVEDVMHIPHQKYQAKDFTVEADWSAASYYYSIVALAEKAHLKIDGLHNDSLQGDSAIAEISKKFGIETTYTNEGIEIVKAQQPTPFIEYNFLEQPDIAQTVFVIAGGLGIHGLYSGLKTLYIKETDRINAMKTELAKFQVFLSKVPPKFAKNSKDEKFMQDGQAKANESARIQTYRDHRMAMAFAPLSLLFPLKIDNPGVVSKSYPAFWEHLQSLGFIVRPNID
jgi:3-phosphoshikimate 1-carboxyvinyltransferase